MRIGELNKLIDIQYKTRVADGVGGFTETYATRFSGVFASIKPLTGIENLQANQMSMGLTHRIEMHYRGGIRPDWRIKYGNRYFAIMSIINVDEANRELQLLCKEVRV